MTAPSSAPVTVPASAPTSTTASAPSSASAPPSTPASAPSSASALASALRVRAGAGGAPLVLPLAGGAGALVRRRARRRLVSVLDPAELDPARRGLVGWLERRQARTSALLLTPERAIAMTLAGRWRLDLARIRIVEDVHRPPAEVVARHLAGSAARGPRPRPWHSG